MILNTATLLGGLFIWVFTLFVDGTKARKPYYGGRVVGGRLAEHDDFPFIVSIQKYKENRLPGNKWIHACGGSIVNPMWILTACHCVAYTKEQPLKLKNAEDYRIVAGVTSWHDITPERQEIGAEKFIAHQKCNRGGFFHPYTYYDAGLIELKSPLKYSIQVQPLKLFSRDPDTAVGELRRLQQENAHCLSPGWGRIEQAPKIQRSPHLKVANQTLHTARECHEILCDGKDITETPEGKCLDFNKIEQVCVTSEDASICNGDSGGPLVCNGYDFGVVSQVGSSCTFGGMQIFSGIRSILNLVNEYIPDMDYDDESTTYSEVWDTTY